MKERCRNFGNQAHTLFSAGILLMIASSATAQDAMFVDSTGNVGVGTNVPAFSVHISREDAALRVEDSTGTGPRTMFQLINPGGKVRFLFNSAGDKWTFDADNSGNSFNITNTAATGNLFRLLDNGDLRIQGAAYATNHVNTSSRSVKTGFSPVDEKTVLDKVAALDVSQWRYKKEVDGDEHIGPMAEDFHRIFGLGDSKHISTVDTAGVAFAAIKGLDRNVESIATSLESSSQEIRQLRDENTELRTRIERLEALIAKQAKR